MAKKERKEVPESELTEEEVRRWFNRLRELYKEAMYRIHEMKSEKKNLNVKICELEHENSRLIKRNKFLEAKIESESNKKEKKEKEKNTDKVDFKKKFLDSL